ncbi:SusC/RagA family TonB-linked outer membrane protein [Chitinophaga silvatica]|uniref:SusC/RagA family TonB-linked outer membrane protein n=1 Tax=Chitinophaga silvatica TaxID=2282649 RepID=A0A3E1Y3H4_9BACT|nr:SusC/RagA family TonB-linked outer membrane protein [Chitinophaga silvatica]RFS19239.1 SusC/RagA family TonB-linked outer membrane protein [Chitinophaga silvatica]
MQKNAYGGLYFSALRGSRLPAQISKVMRLLPVFMVTALVSVQAAGSAQSVTLSGKNLSLKKVFSVIEKQTGYVLFSNKELLSGSKTVSLSVADVPLNKVLDLVLKDQELGYVLQGKTIILSGKPSTTAIPGLSIPVPVSVITGRVTDVEGTALPGVSIQVKETQKGIATASDGSFSISASEGNTIRFSYVGYTTREMIVTAEMLKDGQPPLIVRLNKAATKLDEVAITVNTGYQSISRERMTGAYSSLQTKRLEGKLQSNLLSMLEGQAAGVAITKDGKVEVRGRSTFLANGDPLVVIDGYPAPGGLETVNIDNVESITVLKDAVAASIYGARSSNGVIVITTKTPKVGKMQISYKGITGMTLRPQLSYLNKTSAADYVDAEVDYYNSDVANVSWDYEGSSFYGRVTQLMIMKDQGLLTEDEVNAELSQLKKNNTLDQLEKNLFRRSLTQQHNISISASTDKFATNAAVRYIANQGNMKGNSNDRLILDLKNDWKPGKRVNVKMFSNINFNNSKAPLNAGDMLDFTNWKVMKPYYNVVDQFGKPQNVPVTRPDLVDLYNDYGGLKSMEYNPLNDLSISTTKNQAFLARMGASISVDILDGLSGEVGGSWSRGSGILRNMRGANSYYVRSLYNAASSVTNPGKHYLPEGAILSETRSQSEAYTFRAQANYGKTFNKRHRISVIAGSEINKDLIDNNTAPSRVGYNDQAGTFATFNYLDFNSYAYQTDFLFPDGMDLVSNGSYSLRDNRFVSVYSNGSYEYDNRFILSGSARIDQGNLFGTNPKYRYKPNWSVGGTYKLSNEKFFNVAWIDKLNIRGSYGINGNISFTQGPFLLITPGSFAAATGAIPYTISSLPDNNLRWERTMITNVGTDLRLLNGRLNLTLDYYNKLSKDLLSPDFIDPTYGRFMITRNAGSSRNTGIELSLESDVVKTKHFGWNVFFNGSYNKSKVLQFNYDYLVPNFLTFSFSSSMLGSNAGAVLMAGYPLDAIFSYRFAGLDNTGTPQYYSVDNKKIYGKDLAVKDMVFSGTARPKYIVSITNTFSYDRFDLSFMMIAQMGAVFRRDAYNGDNIDHKDVSQRWRKPGDEEHTIYPKLAAFNSDAWYFPYSEMMIEKSDFLKLRDLTLGYRLDNKLWGNTGLNNARLYFQGRNLWTLTANKVGVDPETIEQSVNMSVKRTLPLRPEFYIGFSVNL